MNRRDFLKVGLASASLLFIPVPFKSFPQIPVQAAAQGKMFRGTASGEVHVSEDGGKTWKLHTQFGHEFPILDMVSDRKDQLSSSWATNLTASTWRSQRTEKTGWWDQILLPSFNDFIGQYGNTKDRAQPDRLPDLYYLTFLSLNLPRRNSWDSRNRHWAGAGLVGMKDWSEEVLEYYLTLSCQVFGNQY